MGCFSAPHERKAKYRSASSSSSSRSQPSLQKAAIASSYDSVTSSSNSSRKFQLRSHSSSKARSSPLYSASFKFINHQPKSLLGTSSSLFFDRKKLHSADIDVSQSFGHGGVRRHVITHSAPISYLSIDSEPSAHLFPLPLPPSVSSAMDPAPTDDTSSQSTSSTGSGSSSSSVPLSTSSVSAQSDASKSPLCTLSTADSHHLHQCNLAESLQAMPLPPPPESSPILREFSYDELAGACLNFAPEFLIRDGGAGPVFRAILKNSPHEEGSIVAVTRLSRAHLHSFKKWRMEVVSLARLSHPHLCKVLGFSGEDPSKPLDKIAAFQRERLLVYEHPFNGSLESLLYRRKGKAPLEWTMRIRVAMGVAKGLSYLHDRIPRQIVYKSFKTINVQVDQNFNAKLSDYGFARSYKELPSESPARLLPMDDAYAAPETRMSNDLSTKSNVWSFGIVLLELLTGRQHMEDFFPPEERNLVQWCRPYLLDTKRLYLIMDPELKGRYPTRAAKMLADLALQCLMEDPVARPSMRDVVVVISSYVNASDASDPKAPITRGEHSYPFNTNHSNGSHGKLMSDDGSSYSKCGSKFRLSKSYNLASVLASPARSFGVSSRPHEHCVMYGYHHQDNNSITTKWKAFLSGEIAKEAASLHSLIGSISDHPLLSQTRHLSGEIGAQSIPMSPISKDYLPPPLGRSIASCSSHFISG